MIERLGEKVLKRYDFWDIMTFVMESFGAKRLILRVPVHEESEFFKTIYDSESKGPVLEEKRDVLSAYYLSYDKPLFIADFKKDIFNHSDIIDDSVKGIEVVPIVFSGRVVGIMYMVFYSHDKVEELKVKIEEILPFLGLIVAYRLKELELSESALLDKLTNLPSSSYFWQRLDEEFKRAKRYSRRFALMLVDIDHLKKVNENYGHRTTDKLLRKFAELAKSHFRRTDIIARFGGDEFAVILPETGMQNIYQVAEGFRLRVMSTPFEIEMGPRLNITVSASVINYPSVYVDPDSLVEKLFEGIKEAKEEGGNRTVLIKQ